MHWNNSMWSTRDKESAARDTFCDVKYLRVNKGAIEPTKVFCFTVYTFPNHANWQYRVYIVCLTYKSAFTPQATATTKTEQQCNEEQIIDQEYHIVLPNIYFDEVIYH